MSSLWDQLAAKHEYHSIVHEPIYEPNWGLYRNAKNIMFVRVPKTAGTSILQAFKNKGWKQYNLILAGEAHLSYSQMIDTRHIARTPSNRDVVFTVVRNPFDWLVSFYHYTGRHKSFKGFLHTWDSEQNITRLTFMNGMIFDQLYTLNPNGNNISCRAHIIMRYECLKEGWQIFTHNMNVTSYELPRLNVRGKRDYKTYYTPELIKIVEEKCAEELELFGYSFDGPTDNSIFIDPMRCNRIR